MYTIGQAAAIFGLPVSTLRYYDKQGLFPDMERVSGRRKFTDKEIDALWLIACLKKSGLEIKDIKRFMDWCVEGPSTYGQRRELFVEQKKNVEAEIAHLKKVLDMLKFKCWFYEQAMRYGSDEPVLKQIPDHLPREIRRAYDNAHKG